MAAGLICTSFFTEELKIKRNLGGFHDSRVHACLYFITPNGHGLKSIDLVCMKKLDAKVNIIPIIAKADTINKTELNNFKVLKKIFYPSGKVIWHLILRCLSFCKI